jgi:alkanesulfonate monooxygenase SsuD/methylene tetrahydromethanopterin reductase-like flavin-dependent oxidoreductase (luciferase family)
MPRVTLSDFPSSGSRLTGPEIVELCVLAESVGLARFGISDFPFHRDLVPLMTACLAATDRIVLESLVTSPHYRLPEITACTFATMAELSGGRVILGLGRGGVPLAIPPWGRSRPDALRAMREMVVLCRTMWSGGAAPTGGVLPTTGMALSFPLEVPIPILIAGGGPRMLALAGEIADIVHLASPFVGLGYLGELVAHIEGAAASVGRSRDAYEIDVTIPVSVLPEGDRARRLAKVTAAMGVSWMSARVADRTDPESYPEEFRPAVPLVAPITEGWDALGDTPLPDSLADRITDEVLSRFSIAGTAAEAEAGLARVVRALPGATGIRVKLPSLTGEDAYLTYRTMITELGGVLSRLSASWPPA